MESIMFLSFACLWWRYEGDAEVLLEAGSCSVKLQRRKTKYKAVRELILLYVILGATRLVVRSHPLACRLGEMGFAKVTNQKRCNQLVFFWKNIVTEPGPCRTRNT